MSYAFRRVLCFLLVLSFGPGFLLGQSVISSWTLTAPLPQTCAGGKGISFGSHLIAVCGSASGNATYVSKIDGLGNALNWTTTLALPSIVGSWSPVRIGEYVVVPYPGNSYVGKLGTDGSVLSWTASPGTTSPAINGRAVTSDGDRVYSLGGGLAGSIYANVEMATLDLNGVLSPWQSLLPLPVPIHDPQATVIGGYLYVFGGESGGVGSMFLGMFAGQRSFLMEQSGRGNSWASSRIPVLTLGTFAWVEPFTSLQVASTAT